MIFFLSDTKHLTVHFNYENYTNADAAIDFIQINIDVIILELV